MSQLAQIARKARLSKKVSQGEAALNIGITQAFLHYIERGSRKQPNQEILRKMADYYGLRFDDLCLASRQIPEDVLNKIITHKCLLEMIRELKISHDLVPLPA